MNSRAIVAITTIALGSIGVLAGTEDAKAAVSNADYSAVPPFVSSVTTPNILLLLDNSGSMADPACDPSNCGVHSDGSTTPVVQTYVSTTKYTGFFDSLKCYTYDATAGNTRFSESSIKASIAASCSSTEWDGNLLNWSTFRRFDALKKAMSGGDCVVTRAADGTCPATGTPALKTVKAQSTFDTSSRGHVTFTIPSGTGNGYSGRIPTSATPGIPSNIRVHLRGGVNGMGGSFCIDDDSTAPGDTATSCSDSDGFTETQYQLRLAVNTEPTGVIQQIGSKARFGLFEFKGAGDGGRVLVGLGARQSIDWSGSTVETFNTNTAAMLDALGESYPSTWTPLSESLYESARYIAQINSTFLTNAYVYPIAFSGGNSNGVAFQATGVGSIGAAEISALTGTETCPAGYITNACGRDPYFFGSNHTPAWAAKSQVANCCQTFVIIVTDGEPTQDTNIPSNLQDFAHAATHGLHCTGSSTTIHTANGTCNTNNATPPATLLAEHKTDYASNGNHYLDDVAYWMHTTDLRQATIPQINVAGHDIPGMQNATVYTFFTFGNISGREILMQTAKMGAFTDSNGNGRPDLTAEYDKENNLTGSIVPDGIPDAYFESSNVDDIQDKLLATIASILRRSSSGSSVSVLATASTGEGALYQSYFYPSTIEPSTLSDVKWTGYTQSLFIDTFGNTREDTNQDGRLDYKVDRIIKTRFDAAANVVKVDKYVDSDGDGLPNDQNGDNQVTVADCNPCGKVLSDILPIWEAGKQLALKDSSTRTILTWVDSDHDGVVDAGEQIPFTTGNEPTLRPYLRAASSTEGTTIINFVRGCDVATCSEQSTTRDRRLQVPPNSGALKVWKLGDIIHSTPTVVASPRDRHDAVYGDQSYSAFLQRWYNRRQVAYVGGNDGMLHAFNAGYYHPGDDTSASAPANTTEHGWFTTNPTDNSTGVPLGDELWGFVPYELLPQLAFLTRADYQHAYYVDLPLKVADVRIFPVDGDHPNGWGTILIGGFRMGGSCGACTSGTGAPPLTVNISGTNYTFYSSYFAMDITNPDAPKLLWSFSRSDLGLATSVPAVVRVNPAGDAMASNANAKWYMVVGSGPTGYDASVAQTAKLFVIDLATGPGSNNSLVTSLSAGTWNSYIGDMTAFDKNLDYRHDVVYFGRVINDGAPPWRGKVYRLTMGAGGSTAKFGTVTSPTQWGITSGGNQVPTEMLDTFSSGAEMGPVSTAPSVTVDDAANVWVFVGSGRYESAADKTDLSTQYFVGLKDSVLNAGCNQTVSITNCMENNLVDVSNATVCVVGVGDCGQASGTTQVSGVTGATTFTGLIGLVQSKDGWMTQLLEPANPPSQPSPYGIGERVVNSPTVFGGVVFFPTYIPTNDICLSSGTSRLWALFYKTGSAYQEPIIGTAVSGANQTVNRFGSLGEGLAFGIVVHMGSGRDGGSPFGLLINMSQGNFGDCATCGIGGNPPGGLPSSNISVPVAIDPRSRYFSWTNM
ncbi:MAG: Type IV fimbrial biogenesis protein PilY1 [Nitrospira sp.]|jgi:type IV pilus assembly protein PilY1|nr:MAG: Type IV fimbrial biogenesis protein PilY1 [Nitrospira sp.]